MAISVLVALLVAIPIALSRGADAATAVAITQFPAQGPCTFTNTFGAPRPGGTTAQGVDIIAAVGRKVYAVDDGTLAVQYLAASNPTWGNGWRLMRADGTFFFYAHLSAFASGLKAGSKVKTGQILGEVGATGNAGMPHLHFEIHPNRGAAVDPTPAVQRVNGCGTSIIPSQPTTTTTTIPPPPPLVDKWQFVTPVKVFDTTGHSRVAAGSTTTVKVNAVAGVPSASTGVMVRVVARNALARGNLTLHACGTLVKATSLSFAPGRLNATMTLVATSAGAICATTTAAIDLSIDVVGYVSTVGVGLRPVPVRRAVDTRSSGPLLAGATIAATNAALGVSGGDKAVTVTVTLVGATRAGSFGIGQCGGAPWIVPFVATSAQVFSAVVRTAGSDICMSSTQTLQVVLDVSGVWTGASGVVPSGPTRLFDSRLSGIITHTVVKAPVVLASGKRRAQLTLTLVGVASPGVLYAWPCTMPRPAASVGSVQPGAFATVVMSYDATHGGLCMASNNAVHVTVDAAAMG
ncbi:MAG: M23 family metallopeptidase [Actinomycetota bacterium]